jgi:hypothetical protein
MSREPIKILGDIIINQMGLAPDKVFLYNQDYKIPPVEGIWIVIDFGFSTNFGTSTKYINTVDGMNESLFTCQREQYTINILSKNQEARLRKEEVLLALQSSFSQEMQEKYQFHIAKISPQITNLSYLEGGSMLNRFGINVTVLASYEITKNIVDIFENFSNNIIDN